MMSRQALRRVVWATLIAIVVTAAAWLGYSVGERRGIHDLRAESNHRLDLFSAAIEGVIKRLEHVPATIQLNKEVLSLLREPDDKRRLAQANDYLRRLNAHMGSMAVFVMNDRGMVLASSNGDKPDDSHLAEDLSFRPYFLEALSGRVGRHFAIGIHGDEPGYFVSHPIRDGARVVGVAAIKIGLEPIDQTWEMLGAHALLADTNQVVIMSSQPEWRYTALAALPLERRVDLQLTRMYNNRRIPRFPLAVQTKPDDDGQVLEGLLPGDDAYRSQNRNPEMLVLSRTLDGMDWRLMTFSDLRAVRSQALVYSMMSAVAASFLLLLALYAAQHRRIQRQRHEARLLLERVNAELEQNVASRTQALTNANDRLRNEVRERESAELTLRDAQGELVHAAKIAMLGQLATCITHELTQPLGAIRTLSGNASEFLRRGDLNALSGNLNIIARMADQMGSIIQPLKGFARKSLPIPVHADVAHAIGNALFLYGPRLRNESVEVINRCVPGRLSAWCDPNRLEQVLINLVGNAIDAMAEAPCQVLTLEAFVEAARPVDESSCCCHELDGDEARYAIDHVQGWVRIDVLDTGSGLPADTRSRLFEPFFTTKANGAGLGLGLAISRDIVREFHGDIEAAARPGGGARFSLLLPTGPVIQTAPAAARESRP
ncbi:ATP-binding protein [soil metagenome]